jgi:hypothetical protein
MYRVPVIELHLSLRPRHQPCAHLRQQPRGHAMIAHGLRVRAELDRLGETRRQLEQELDALEQTPHADELLDLGLVRREALLDARRARTDLVNVLKEAAHVRVGGRNVRVQTFHRGGRRCKSRRAKIEGDSLANFVKIQIRM